MSLFIGAYYPDKELSESDFGKALVEVAVNLAKQKQPDLVNSNPNVDLQFMLPGKNEIPDFNGMRMCSFNLDSKTLHMESSVPIHLINSKHAKAYVIAAMQDAIENAHAFFTQNGAQFEHELYASLIKKIKGSQIGKC